MLTCSAQVFEGHPFIVEAGVSLGGKDVKQVSFFLFSLTSFKLATYGNISSLFHHFFLAICGYQII